MQEKIIGTVRGGTYIVEKKDYAHNVPAFIGGESEGVFAGGDNSFIVCINNVKHGDIADYINTLEQEGYSEVFENKIGDNLFYSYSNGENLIFVYYIKAINSAKLIAEPFYDFSYNEAFSNVTQPAVITSSACDRNYYVRLPNNKMVVIDGGWRIEDRSRYTYEELLLDMYKEMAEVCNCEVINVPLWIITHAHNDHAKVLEHLYKYPFADKFKIDRILYNFPHDDHLKEVNQVAEEKLEETRQNLKKWHENAGKDYPYEDIFYNCPFPVYESIGYEKICREAFGKYGAVNIKAHDGMRFDMSGVVFEVLHTPDDDMPTIYGNMNDTSLVIKMTYENSATLWLGDMGVIPGDSCIEMYGDYLKCDAVQVSHHGWGSASWEFFKLLNPKILIWNNSEFGFQYADKYQGYGKTESSTRLFNMPCVKENYFCNTIKMQYINLPFEFKETTPKSDYELLVSAASDRTFMIKLKDGKLIMINGGWRKEAWDRYDHETLLNNLFGEMQNFAGTENITVAAWILTDADFNDNNQLIANLENSDFANKIKIGNIVHNFPIGLDAEHFTEKIASLNANRIIAQTEQSLTFDGVNIKILYASNGEECESLRDASIVVMVNVNGKKILFTGNMTDRISKEILISGKDLKCDIMQIANHGLDNCGVLEFYEKADAKILIWNTSEYAYRFFSPTEGYEKSEVSTAVYNFENTENYFCDRILPQIIELM